jgi:putative acetyltransferase
VGCGGLILGDADSAEITALVVAPEARGAGLGELLAKLEEAGRSEGVRVLRLRTGARQSEALALFSRQGYCERGPFGSYENEGEELGTFLEKWIG